MLPANLAFFLAFHMSNLVFMIYLLDLVTLCFLCWADLVFIAAETLPSTAALFVTLQTDSCLVCHTLILLVNWKLLYCVVILSSMSVWSSRDPSTVVPEKNQASPDDYAVSRLCFGQTAKPPQIDVADIKLQQVSRYKSCWSVLVLLFFVNICSFSRLWAVGILQQFGRGHTETPRWLWKVFLQAGNINSLQRRTFMSFP